ncbi:cyclin-dependent kinase inhibitor 3-like [Asterias rubens]|uniref:cyclin-dependent kinase inhibitor 3-like n=1 Tax=Asterias rubens TaxID=7604 RepID=UPI0014555D53|nr:cyclin-dependent kinase inhibitor 3-like [Asterias rubens]
MSTVEMGVPSENNIQKVELVDMIEVEDEMSDSDHNADCDFDTSDDEQSFDTLPLKINWLDVSPYGLPGQLGLSDLPGCRFSSVWRKLKTDIDDLKKIGISDMFPLCTKAELIRYRVPNLLSDYATAEFSLHYFPIQESLEITDILEVLDRLRKVLSAGRKLLLHCYGGQGRSCIIAACLLLQLDQGMSSETAIKKLQELRGHNAIETVKQYNFVNDFRKLEEECHEAMKTEGELRSVSR